MQDLRTLLSEERLKALRSGYSQAAMLEADLAAVARVAPQFVAWNQAIAATFYEAQGPLKAVDRERCLIALIVTSGPAISLAMHVYWGLMEGLSIAEITQVIALAGCYGGLPRSMFGIETAHRTLRALAQIPAEGPFQSVDAVQSMLTEFSRA